MALAKQKRVFLIISDLHYSYKNKDSRIDYQGEIGFVLDKILSLIDEYKNKGYSVCLIFLGDIIDNSFKSMQAGINFNNYFVYFEAECEKVYSVVGNHEMSYYKDNPFWCLFNRIDSPKLKRVLTRSWQPQGTLQLVNIVDSIELGNSILHFNHHAVPTAQPVEGKINIGLFHKDIVSKAIVADMQQNLGLDIFEGRPSYIESSPVIQGYDYCYFGHLHKIYGEWIYTNDETGKETRLNYLASLGRPNHSEVKNNFLERNIPALIFDEDNNFKCTEDNKFNLSCREESVIEHIILEKQRKYKDNKERKKLINYNASSDNPIQNINAAIGDNYELLYLFDTYVQSEVNLEERDLLNNIEEVLRY